MANDFKIAQPLEYYKHFLAESIRPDGRGLSEYRNTLLNVGSISSAYGSAILKLGNTMVVCGINAELAEPSPLKPNMGFFVPNIELPPLCSPKFRPGPPDEKAQVLSQLSADMVSNSGLLKMEDLCIEEKKLCWVIYADVMCMSHDGNLIDAVMTVLFAALQNLKLPRIQVNKENGLVEQDGEKTFKLNLMSRPVSTTVALFDGSILLVDPSHDEENLSSGTVTVIVGSNQELYSVYKPGGQPIDEKVMRECMEAALNRHKEVTKLLDEMYEDVDR